MIKEKETIEALLIAYDNYRDIDEFVINNNEIKVSDQVVILNARTYDLTDEDDKKIF